MTPGHYIPTNYLPVLIALITATIFAFSALLIGEILRPRKPSKTKLMPYESGNDPVGMPTGRYSIRFYVIAMLFVVFDVEIIFLYPWAVVQDLIGTRGFLAMMGFLGIILLGYAYDWKKGALDK